MRILGRIFFLLCVLAVGIAASSQTGAQSQFADVYYRKAYGAWTVECAKSEKRPECSLTATANNGPLIAAVSVAKPVSQSPAVAVALAAYDFDQSPVGIRIDNSDVATTTPNSSKLALFDAEDSALLIDRFKNGQQALVYFVLAPTKQRQAVLLPLIGFGAAFKAYEAQLILLHPSSLGGMRPLSHDKT